MNKVPKLTEHREMNDKMELKKLVYTYKGCDIYFIIEDGMYTMSAFSKDGKSLGSASGECCDGNIPIDNIFPGQLRKAKSAIDNMEKHLNQD